MWRAERSAAEERDDERAPEAAAPVPPLLALQQAGAGNRALSRWLLQREQTYEEAAAELRAISPAALSDPTRQEQFKEELADWEWTGDPIADIDAIDKRRARIDARLREEIQRDVLAGRREQDAAQRAQLDTREAAVRTALDAAHTGAAPPLKTCRTIQAEYQKFPYMQHDAAAKAAMDDAKAVADERAAALLGLRVRIKAARDAVAGALGTAAREAAIPNAETAARDAASAAKAAVIALRPHEEALTRYTAKATVPERTALMAAAVELGLPENLARKILIADMDAPAGDIQERLTAKREEHQSIPGPTLVTSVFGMGVTHRGANTAGIDRIGEVNGKRVHLTLYWDQVTQGPINLNQSDDAILAKTLGLGAMTCMHVTAEAWGPFDNRNPSYYWRGAKKNIASSAPRVGVTLAELENQLQALCEGIVGDFKTALAQKRAALGASDPTPAPPPAAPPPPS